MQIINTHTGKMFVSWERHLEFLTVRDYGKEKDRGLRRGLWLS